jgi:type IV pilus assembly protein PilM
MTTSLGWTRSLAASARRLFGTRPRLGVDLGGAQVRIVELRRHSDQVEIVAAAEPTASRLRADGSIEDVDAVAAQIRDLRIGGGVRSTAATTAIPASVCVVRHLTLAARSRRDLDRSVAEAIEALGLDDGRDWSIDWSPLRRRASTLQTEVLLVAVPTDVVRSYVACLREADLLPVAVDVDVVALDRFAPLVAAGGGRVVAFLDIDGPRCVLNVIRHGDAAFHAAVSRRSPVPASDDPAAPAAARELAEAVHEILGFFWTGDGEESVAEVWMSGSGAHMQGLAENIENRLRVATHVLEPFRLLGSEHAELPAAGSGDGPEWALATALALRGFAA